MKTSSPKLTPGGNEVLTLARDEAVRWSQSVVFTQHLLLGCIRFGKGRMAKVLDDHGVKLEAVRQEFLKLAEVGPKPDEIKRIPFSPKVNHLLSLAMSEAITSGRAYVDAEQILLALLREVDGAVLRVLNTLKVDVRKLQKELLDGCELRR